MIDPPAFPTRPDASGSATAPPDKIRQSARDFEAMTIGQMLQPMFSTLEQGGLFDGGEAEQTLKPMLVTEFANMMEARGGLGLEQPVMAAMLRAQAERK